MSKQVLPLERNNWRVLKELGWEFFLAVLDWGRMFLIELIGHRLDETIITARKIIEGKLRNPDRILTHPIFPPLCSVRSDLQPGTMTLLYGESVDISFTIIDDEIQELISIINGHAENGIPVDWWRISQDDEFLNQKPLNLGYKLREIPARCHLDIKKIGVHMLDMVKGFRNHKTPLWSLSSLVIGPALLSSVINLIAEVSSWELLSGLWDGINAKRVHGIPNPLFSYIPWPPLVSTFVNMSRVGWLLKINGLFSEHKLFLGGLEEIIKQNIKENVPEFYNNVFNTFIAKKGIPKPLQTLKAIPPNWTDKRTFETEAFDWNYPEGWIKVEDLGVDVEEMLNGVLLDVTHETPLDEKIDSDKIISQGIGRNTNFRK